MRAVLDPNVLISALLAPKGAPGQVLAKWVIGEFELVVSPLLLAELERARYDNPKFVPITLVDYTAGYDSECAVLFPETIAVRQAPEKFSWGGIFCDREAARFRRVSEAAVQILGVELPADIRDMLADQSRCQQSKEP